MTSSRSKASTSKWWVIAVALLLLGGIAHANPRKRVVVLDLDGPKGDKFHDELVKLLKKTATVISVDKWNGVAEELSATGNSPGDIKKVAKKLKIDGVVRGTVEKRRDSYLLKLKLHAGTSGKVVGNVDTKSEEDRIDAGAKSDIQDELVASIGELEANRGGGGGDEDEDEDKPTKVAKKPPVEDEEDKPVKKSGFAKRDDEETGGSKVGKVAKKEPVKPVDDEEDKPVKKPPAKVETAALRTKTDDDDDKPAKPAKKVAAREDDEDEDGGGVSANSGDDDGAVAANKFSIGERAVDAVLGLSVTARRMSFKFGADTAKPPGYKGKPVAGGVLDVTVYPFAIGHKRKGALKHVGLTAMYDQVFSIKSETGAGMKLKSSESRWAAGLSFRYPFSDSPTAPVVGGTVRYGKQKFTITGDSGLPDVSYTMLEPMVFFKYPLGPKLALSAAAGYIAITDSGEISNSREYGASTVSGIEAEVGAELMITENIYARLLLKGQTIGHDFKGDGMRSDGVAGARDSYYGGQLTGGYAF